MGKLAIVTKREQVKGLSDCTVLALYSTPEEGIKQVSDYYPEKESKELDRETLYLMDLLGQQEAWAKKLRAVLEVENVPLWESVSSDLFIDNFLFPTIKDICESLNIISRAVEKESPDTLIVFGKDSLEARVARVICREKDIKLKVKGMHSPRTRLMPSLVAAYRNISFVLRAIRSRKRKIDKGKKVLISFNTVNANSAYPVIKGRGDFLVVTLNRNIEGFWMKKGVPFLPLESFFSPYARKLARRKTAELLQYWRGLKGHMGKEGPSYLGYKVWPLVEDRMEYLFRIRFPELVRMIYSAHEILHTVEPKGIIILNEIVADGIVPEMAAKAKGTRTIGIQHGMMPFSPVYEKIRSKNMLPEYMAVSGQYWKALLRQKGFNEDKIYVTGQPRYDSLIDLEFNKPKISSELGINPRRNTILLTTQPAAGDITPEGKREMVRGTLEAAKKNDIQLIIKLHPREDDGIVDEIVSELDMKEKVIITKDADLYDLIDLSSVMVTWYSTTALESMIFEKPVVCVNLSKREEGLPYTSSGAAIGVREYSQIEPSILSAIKGITAERKKKMKNLVYQLNYRLDGKSAERTMEAIERVLL